jgi:RNA polymerase sigma factor (sigma-70 family)
MEEEINPISRQMDQLAEIQHCIDKMDEPCHSIFRMRFDDDLTIREIAEHTKLSVGTVHKYLQQGIQQIKLHFNQKMS